VVPFAAVRYEDGRLTLKEDSHDLWILADQDCDLSATETTDEDRYLELRAVRTCMPETKLPSGIRSRILRLSTELTVQAGDARAGLTARALHSLSAAADRSAVDRDARRSFKTWLGLRYDRPAVPEAFASAAKGLLKLLQRSGRTGEWTSLRDIFVTFEDAPHDVPVARLFAVLWNDKAGDCPRIEAWLRDIQLRLSQSAGSERFVVIGEISVQPTSRTPVDVLERSYGLDSARFSLSYEDTALPN
jgi:hypothetical protein